MSRRFRLIGPVAFVLLLTGASGLIYEVAWQRYLGVLVGVDHAATAATLAVFLGGLSLGYAICGGLSARTRRPLATYAWLEVAIAVWGLAFPWTFSWTETMSRSWSFSPPFGLIGASLGVAVLLVLVPAMLMGATVPFIARYRKEKTGGLDNEAKKFVKKINDWFAIKNKSYQRFQIRVATKTANRL